MTPFSGFTPVNLLFFYLVNGMAPGGGLEYESDWYVPTGEQNGVEFPDTKMGVIGCGIQINWASFVWTSKNC